MNKQKTRILIPFILVVLILIFCWWNLFANNYIPSWKHYLAIALFVAMAPFALKKMEAILIPLGIYLFLASVHIISLSYNQSTFGIGSDAPYNPSVQPMSFGILLLYLVLNMDSFIERQLDYRERKALKKKIR